LATTRLLEFDGIRLTLRRDTIPLRRCKGCGWEGPAYLGGCRRCRAALGEPYSRGIVLVVPEFVDGVLPARILPVAALALELSGDPSHTEALCAEARALLGRFLTVLPESAVLRPLGSGVLVALFPARSLAESARAAARGAAALDGDGRLEWRAGLAVGLIDGAEPWRAAVAEFASQLARAAQAGQTLAGYGTTRLLDHEWQFGPAGILPRRQEPAVSAATAFLGPKAPAPTPSLLVHDGGPGLVGRERELALLDAEFARVRAGEARWYALVAPAGCGKSKLLRTWLGRLDSHAVRVFGAAASPFGQAPRGLIDQLLAALASPLAADAPAGEVLETLEAALERAARERPLVVLIDDLHWADADSLALLRALSVLPLHSCLVVLALRNSFVSSVPWLLERARRLELPPLNRGEREELLRRLLPNPAAALLRAKLAAADQSGNPLYFEHAAAYLAEAGPAAPLPCSLHEAVLHRLEFVRARIDRRCGGFERPSPGELATIERIVGEWLDRLETGDYDDRTAIAAYLNLLEQIDVGLVIAGNIAGVPQLRNRRLAAAIERFYSASFGERVKAIELLAEHGSATAGHAAARGGERAVAAIRLEDAAGYFELAQRLALGEDRARHLLALGDVLLARGLARRAWHAYAEAVRGSLDDKFRARCERRLARAALAHGRPRAAESLLERALPRLTGHEEVVAACDLTLTPLLIGRHAAPKPMLDQRERVPETPELKSLVLRTRLRRALLRGVGDLESLARECASALVLEGDGVADLAALVDTTLLLHQALPARCDPTLLAEAKCAARRLGNVAAEARLLSHEGGAAWRPLHAMV